MWKFSAVYTNGLYWTSVEQDVVFKITFWLDLWFSNCGADPTASALTTIYKYDVKIIWINMIYFYKETQEFADSVALMTFSFKSKTDSLIFNKIADHC